MKLDDNPILNNPYSEPSLFYATELDGSLNYDKILKGRRPFQPDLNIIPVKSRNSTLKPIHRIPAL